MKICYVDEAGCTGVLPHPTSQIQPILLIVGLIIDYGRLHRATEQLLQIKQRFFPAVAPTGRLYLSGILSEIKGSDLRRDACAHARNLRRHTFGFLNGVMQICQEADARLVGRVWVKGIGQPFDGRSAYTSSIQAICSYFQDYLTRTNDLGIVIADSRLKHLNSQVAHSIFTQKFKSSGDQYDRIIELPSFSHSDNHAGLQLADALCSGIITPMATHTYCAGHITSVHVRPGYARIKDEYSNAIRAMQHRFQEASGQWKGGIVTADGIGQRPGSLLFRV